FPITLPIRLQHACPQAHDLPDLHALISNLLAQADKNTRLFGMVSPLSLTSVQFCTCKLSTSALRLLRPARGRLGQKQLVHRGTGHQTTWTRLSRSRSRSLLVG